MSWKAVELQVALPRTQDAGKIQEQLSKQNQHFQESLAMSQMKQEELRRKRVNELEQIDPSTIHDDDSMNEGEEELNGKEVLVQKEKIKHPYLGSNIDLNG